MRKMFRLNADGTVDVCDDTPDVDIRVKKYMNSGMREGQWVYCYWSDRRKEWCKKFIDNSEVPKIIKLFDLLEP